MTDLIVGGNKCLAGDTRIAEQLLVTFLAVRLVVSQYIPLTDEAAAASAATELSAPPVLLQRLREVGGKQQLQRHIPQYSISILSATGIKDAVR